MSPQRVIQLVQPLGKSIGPVFLSGFTEGGAAASPVKAEDNVG